MESRRSAREHPSLAWLLRLVLALLAMARPARAESEHLTVGAALDYRFPGAWLATGSRVSDVTFGAGGFALDGTWKLRSPVSFGAGLGYGLVIPKLCGTAADCKSSLGYDVALALIGRWHIAEWKLFRPQADLSLGYEWFRAKVSDAGVTAQRSYRGVLTGLDLHALIAPSSRWAVGPNGGLGLGSFAHARIEAPGVTSTALDGRAVHLWWRLGVRASVSW